MSLKLLVASIIFTCVFEILISCLLLNKLSVYIIHITYVIVNLIQHTLVYTVYRYNVKIQSP